MTDDPTTLRPRAVYLERSERWLGFGRSEVEQPDLIEREYRCGYWLIGVCRERLVAKIVGLRDAIATLNKGLRTREAELAERPQPRRDDGKQ